MVNAKKPLAVVLALLMVFSAFFTAGTIGASAASGDIIYFEKPDSWSTVNCYVWGGSSGAATGWPGTAMTLVSGNVYSYTMPGDQTNVIFNNGNGDQTGDGTATYDGTKNYFVPSGDSGNPIGGTWSVYEGPTNPTTPTDPTSATDPTTATDPTQPSGEAAYAYLNNEAGWSTVYAHYWNGNGTGTSWPGVALTDANKTAEGYYEVVIPAEYIDSTKSQGGIIFNNGSGSQSTDLRIGPGESMIYNNSTTSWEIYDTSPLKITSFGTNEKSPQYKETNVTVFASAVNEAGSAIQYQFSVSGAENKVIQAYSTKASVVWTPTVAGTYKIKLDVKDADGNTNSRTIDYVIKDDATEANAILKGITPATGSVIKTNQKADVTVNASGGQVGTNLLFYKVSIVQQSTQKVVNGDVYYSLNKNYSFTPAQDGTYTVTVSVQNSKNHTVTNTYDLFASSSEADLVIQSFQMSSPSTVTVGTDVTFTALANGGTQPYQYQFAVNGTVKQAYSSSNAYTMQTSAAGTYTVEVTVKDASNKTATTTALQLTVIDEQYKPGDVDKDGNVTLRDALLVQKAVLELATLDEEQTKIADIDGNGRIDLRDAIAVQ
ncbi:MAG: starch-binding protein, partial [Acutalibacteraceae bacterium]